MNLVYANFTQLFKMFSFLIKSKYCLKRGYNKLKASDYRYLHYPVCNTYELQILINTLVLIQYYRVRTSRIMHDHTELFIQMF